MLRTFFVPLVLNRYVCKDSNEKRIYMNSVLKYWGVIPIVTVLFCIKQEVKNNELDVVLHNVEALANNESATVDCPRGKTECVRVIVGNTVHLFYKL